MTLESASESATILNRSSANLHVGSTVSGRYQIQKELKRGGFGIVYLARDLQLHSRPVVIKILLDEAFQNEYVVQKFRQEIEALSRIDHPGVIGIIDCGDLSDGKPFIVMQYVDGSTLRSLMKPGGMDLEQSADLIRQIGRALSAAHDKGILHRDLKPENIMLQRLGHGELQVKIIDFGIAKVKDSAIAPTTATSVSVGTISYMAPEQLSANTASVATDVYALGQIAYEMLTGQKPFSPVTAFQLLELQRAGVRVNPVDHRPSLPLAAQDIILRALSFDPHHRQQSACQFGDDLHQALKGGPGTQLSNSEASEPLPTQLATEQTPLARTPQTPWQKTIVAVFPVNSPAVRAEGAESQSAARGRRTVLIVLSLVVFLLIAAGGFYLFARGKRARAPEEATASTMRRLSYGLTVQKMRDGHPYQEPFESSGQEIFENGWKFVMNISCPEAGYLYLLNDGPAANGTATLNVLFPAPSTNSGTSYISASQQVRTGWMTFDENQGTEKFWLVWSATSVAELESVKGAVNEKDMGTVSDKGQVRAVRDFLNAHYAQSKPVVEKDTQSKQTEVKGKGDVIVSFIELEHH